MKTIFRSTLATLALTLAGCGGNSADGTLTTLDLEAAIANPRPFDIAEIATEIEFIPLDASTPASLLMGGGQVYESDSRFYIIDAVQSPVKVFDKAGRFVGTRGSIGRGPGEFTAVNGLAVDPATDNIYALTANLSVIAYDADGRMFAENEAAPSFRAAWFDGRLVFMREPRLVFDTSVNNTPPAPDSVETIVEVLTPELTSETEIKRHAKGTTYIITYDEGYVNVRARVSPNILTANGAELLVKEGRSDTVFHYRSGATLQAAMRLDLGKYTPPAEAFGENPRADWSKYYRVIDLMDGGETMFVAVQPALETTRKYLLFDDSGGFTATGPNGESELFLDGIAFELSHARDGRLVGFIQALDIVDHRDKITNPALAALAETLTEDSNPVIVVATLK